MGRLRGQEGRAMRKMEGEIQQQGPLVCSEDHLQFLKRGSDEVAREQSAGDIQQKSRLFRGGGPH